MCFKSISLRLNDPNRFIFLISPRSTSASFHFPFSCERDIEKNPLNEMLISYKTLRSRYACTHKIYKIFQQQKKEEKKERQKERKQIHQTETESFYRIDSFFGFFIEK